MKQTFYKWNIGTINVRTCKDDLKLERVVQEIHKANLEISALQEVRRLKQGSATVKCDNSKYEIYWSGHSLKRQHGVGFVIKVDPNVEIVQVEYVDAQIIVLQTKVYGCLLKVINCYAPTEESSDSSKDLFYRNLHKQFVNVPPKYKVICLGDFNATTSAAWYNSSLRENIIM
ncbi:craniofacial development protein 2-like [Clytia hemisphaerica]|uniref:craniofacial development protein 2-like n=1 Tax=Clytia hemisphaerica TaxID=252671 RepID=UPI0034D79E95